MHPKNWIEIKPQGLYCKPGNFFIDPTSAVESAVITHGHSDHARAGHARVLATAETIAIMQTRYGDYTQATSMQALTYAETISHNGIDVTLLPAGHILGSAQIQLDYRGSRLIVSGDYKRAYDPTCAEFKAVNCDIFITEATFSLPIFNHPNITLELKKLLDSMQMFPERCHLVGAYALGKCQRIIKTLRLMNYHEPIYLHGALLKLCKLYESLRVSLGDIRPASELDLESSKGKIVLCPPSALNDRWNRRFADIVVANASGWMQIRARAKQQGVDLPLIISDHADWNELTNTINEVAADEVWVTHGREEALVYYAIQQGYKAQALSLLGYEEDED